MRRYPSGTTDQYIYFVAVDSTDLKTRETGLSSFTVYRARNGGAATAYTTPTVAELSSANMPGVYSLLLDEDMTIGSGNSSEEVVLHITQASMAPVTLVYELYRPIVTEGEVLTVSSGVGSANVTQFGGAAGTFASGRPEVNTTHWSGTANASPDTAGYPKVTIKTGTGAGELNASSGRVSADVARWLGTAVATPTVAGVPSVEMIDISSAGQTDIRSAVGLASANLDTQLDTLPTANENADALLDRAAGVETNVTVRQAFRLFIAALVGKASGLGTTTAVFRDYNDTKDRITATVDAVGNRTAVTKDST